MSKQSNSTWVTTFADLAALLLTFFVLVFSMAHLDPMELGAGAPSIADFSGNDANQVQQNVAADVLAIPEIKRDRYIESWLVDQSSTHPLLATLPRFSVNRGIGFHSADEIRSFSALRDLAVDLVPTVEDLLQRASIETVLVVQGNDRNALSAYLQELIQAEEFRAAFDKIGIQVVPGLTSPRLALELRR